MEEHSNGPSTPREQAAGLHHVGLSHHQRSVRYHALLRRIYLALLIFVVLAGLPVVGISSLRQRLALRARTLQEAWSGVGRSAVPPVLAKVGENTEPFPTEYEIPLKTWGKGPGTVEMRLPVFRPAPHTGAPEETPKAPPAAEPSEPAETGTGEVAPTYQQGDAEREVYEILLKSSETISGMVQGKDPALRFVKWAAAKREEDTYWVDLTFKSTAGGAEVHYIWQVAPSSKRVTPLSSLAKALTTQ